MVDKHKVGEALLSERFQNCISRVENGETIESRHVLHTISEILSPEKISSFTGKPFEIPDYIRSYLCRCIDRILQGEDANHAFGLTKPGRPSRLGHRDKRLPAYLVYQLHDEQGMPVREACATVAEVINEMANNIEDYPAWRKLIIEVTRFKRKALEEQIQQWYYHHREEIRKIYAEAEL